MASDVIIYHNPECGTSRNTLATMRNVGIDRSGYQLLYRDTPTAYWANVEQVTGHVNLTFSPGLRRKAYHRCRCQPRACVRLASLRLTSIGGRPPAPPPWLFNASRQVSSFFSNSPLAIPAASPPHAGSNCPE